LLVLLATTAACQSSDVSRTVGARCDDQAECDDRCLTPSAEWPGGFCTVTCDDDGDCPSDTACIEEGNGGVCAFTCSDDNYCKFLGDGYACAERDTHPVGDAKVTVCRG
jgi:hypothetical protein